MKATIESNPLIERLPAHLKQFIKPQDYSDYTPINQAVWRYVMRKNVNYLSKVAHESYLNGLKKTGLEIEVAATLVNANLKSKIESDALDFNMLKEKGSRLPL